MRAIVVLLAASALVSACGRTQPDDVPPPFDATIDTVDSNVALDSVAAFDLGVHDSGTSIDTEIPADSAFPDFGPPLDCDGGFFIEVVGETGTTMLRHGCGDAGAGGPTWSRCATHQDQFVPPLVVSGCEGAASIRLSTFAFDCPDTGTWSLDWSAFDDGHGGTFAGGGTMHVTSGDPGCAVGSPYGSLEGGTLEGVYAIEVRDWDASGTPPIVGTIGGRFCVRLVGCY
jgi:hypothetical protein